MLIIEHTVKTKANPDAVWALWSDVSNWKKWDHEIEESELNGPFATGTTGYLKPKGGPKTRFRLLTVEENKMFHDRSNLPLCRLEFLHEVRNEGESILITHRVEMTGPLTFLFSRVIGKNIAKGLPNAMQKLARLAEHSK